MSDTKRTSGGQRDTVRARNASGRSSSRSAASKSGTSRSTSSSRSTQATARRSVERAAASQNSRSAGSGTARRSTSANRRRRRRRQSPDLAKILLILIGLVILIFCVAIGFKSCSNGGEGSERNPASETTKAPETEVHADITVNGISVNGLTMTEAREKILASMEWGMTVSFGGDVKEVENLVAYNVDAVLEKAFSKGTAGDYTVDYEGLEEYADAAAAACAEAWDKEPKNGSISSYDSAANQFIFSGAENGKLIKQDKLASDILTAVKAEEFNKTIEAEAEEVAPEITEAQAKEQFKRIGTYTTTTTSNKARNENVRLAAEALNGKIIQPGEEFSFNLTTGNRTEAKGYKAAGAYVNGVLVEEPGGGVCQVSSTLYNAVVFAGLKTTERHAHSYEPSYVTPGEDAMVSYDGHSGPDMKFINNSKSAVGIKTSFSNQKLIVSVYGIPILEEGVTLSMVSTKTKELAPPEPVYEEDPTLEPGIEVEAKAATPGSRWVTNLVKKKDGVVIEDSVLHNSTYNGKPATIKRNTSGTVASTEGMEGAEGIGTDVEGSVSAIETVAPAPDSTTEAAEDTNTVPGPGQSTAETAGGQASGPADATQAPETEPVTEAVQPVVPQSPADVTSPAQETAAGPGGNTSQVTQVSPGGTTPTAETNASPAGAGLIAPMN